MGNRMSIHDAAEQRNGQGAFGRAIVKERVVYSYL